MKINISIFFLLGFFSFSFILSPGTIHEKKMGRKHLRSIWQEKTEITLKEELSIGVLNGDENYVFHEPFNV